MDKSFFDGELSFYSVCGFRQSWIERRSFSYLDTPRPDHGFLYILCESAKFELSGGEVLTVGRDSVIYLPRGAKYKVTFFGDGDDLHTLLVNFLIKDDPTSAEELAVLKSDSSAHIKERFFEIISLYKNSSNAYFPIMASFFSLLAALFPVVLRVHSEDKAILPAIEYIDTHLNENPSVPELARLCLISESGFRKRFSSALGKTPHEYIISVKLERATKMLANPELPIFEIAETLGFCDAAHFTRIFTARMKKAPGKYRADRISGRGGI